jgi:hypothetical protein
MSTIHTKQPLHQDIADPWANYRESDAPSTCGARRKRTGEPCGRRDIFSNGRCGLHGGLSTGPKTPEGLARSAANGRLGGRPRKVHRETKVHGSVKVTARVGDFPDVSGESKNQTKPVVSNSIDVGTAVSVKRAVVPGIDGQPETKPFATFTKVHVDKRRDAWMAIVRSKCTNDDPALPTPMGPTARVHILPVRQVPFRPHRR